MLQVSLEEAKSRLLELVNAALKGETVVILKDLQEAVQLVPAIPQARRQFGSAKGLIVMVRTLMRHLPISTPICYETIVGHSQLFVVYWRG